ncbi:lipoprotein [Spiroplasma clarkii]|uniref:Lipoprotein n=1 Tax=Spiroplasma clarkii TaxID=2139 RepID=A0A1Y0KZS6_9MOLU|nr:lipoprotein [Spiroplasma clarkii]ARU90969.1 lipoprotein [Spiroplasma clarkii]ATX70410.1 lipoprotein [Spiroplasma clarkii]
MKKLLSLISAIGLVAGTTGQIVSCGDGEKEKPAEEPKPEPAKKEKLNISGLVISANDNYGKITKSIKAMAEKNYKGKAINIKFTVKDSSQNVVIVNEDFVAKPGQTFTFVIEGKLDGVALEPATYTVKDAITKIEDIFKTGFEVTVNSRVSEVRGKIETAIKEKVKDAAIKTDYDIEIKDDNGGLITKNTTVKVYAVKDSALLSGQVSLKITDKRVELSSLKFGEVAEGLSYEKILGVFKIAKLSGEIGKDFIVEITRKDTDVKFDGFYESVALDQIKITAKESAEFKGETTLVVAESKPEPANPDKPTSPETEQPQPDKPSGPETEQPTNPGTDQNQPEKPTSPETEQPQPEKPSGPETEQPTNPGTDQNQPEKPTSPETEQPQPEKPSGPETEQPANPGTDQNQPEKPTSPETEQPQPEKPSGPETEQPTNPGTDQNQPEQPASQQGQPTQVDQASNQTLGDSNTAQAN